MPKQSESAILELHHFQKQNKEQQMEISSNRAMVSLIHCVVQWPTIFPDHLYRKECLPSLSQKE